MRILLLLSLVLSLLASVASFSSSTTTTFFHRSSTTNIVVRRSSSSVLVGRQRQSSFSSSTSFFRYALAVRRSDSDNNSGTEAATDDDDDHALANDINHAGGFGTTILPILTAFIVANFSPLLAHAAAGPDWGIFEGRIGSLLHPITMFSLLAYSVTTAILGFQWRRQRTMGDEIAALKAQLPKSNDDDDAATPKSAAVLALEAQIDALVKERKELAAANPRDKHFSQGALLAFIGTAFAIEGPLNTYARAGKLFPGPHLYAGAGLVVCWALAAACVPSMQKGNNTARIIHITANLGGIGLFVWQVTSGVPILLKVIELTKWP